MSIAVRRTVAGQAAGLILYWRRSAVAGFTSGLAALLLVQGCGGRSVPGVADGPTRVLTGSACPACSVIATPVLELNSSEGATIDWATVLVRSSSGAFFAAPVSEDGSIARWTAAGVALTPIGRQGGGPGEFVAIRAIALTPGDSLLVLDRSRITLLAPDGRFVRSANLPPGMMAFRLTALPDGGVLLNNTGPSLPAFVELDPQFQRRRTFGPALVDPPSVGALRDSLLHLMVVTRRGDLWTLPQRFRYVLTAWSADGGQAEKFVRDVDWFHPWTPAEYQADLSHQVWEALPLPVPIAIGADTVGRVWTSIRVAKRDWAPVSAAGSSGPAGPHQPARRERASDPDPSRFIETAVDVFDPSTGALAASGRVQLLIRGFLGADPLAYAAQEDSLGLIHFSVVRLSILNSDGGPHD